METHMDIDVWKNAIELVTRIYGLTEGFPQHELYGLTNQIRRAAVSIPSNIAEGAGRNYNKEFIQFLYVTLGSMAELETQLIISEKLAYITNVQLEEVLQDLTVIRSQVSGLINYLKNTKQ